MLLLATMIWAVVALVGARMVGIGGAHASGEPRFPVYAISPWPLTAWAFARLAREA